MECGPRLKIIDCTLRDGGYVNQHNFSQEQILHTVTHLVASGVDLVEIGYFRRDGKSVGTAACCPDELLEQLEHKYKNKLAVMLRPNEVRPADVACLCDTAIGYARIPVRPEQMGKGLALARAATDAGLRVCFNVTRASELNHQELPNLLRQINQLVPDVVYFADSNGGMIPSQVERLIRFARQHVNIDVGFHAHDNLSLAVANAVAAINGGASWIDSTIGGLGKGGGNASTEVILSLASHLTEHESNLSSLLDVIAVFPAGLFPPRMRNRVESVVYGLYNYNLESIAHHQETIANDSDSMDIDRLLHSLVATRKLPVDHLLTTRLS
jgi:4-hydroxy 2-oxovalerate aldolase